MANENQFTGKATDAVRQAGQSLKDAATKVSENATALNGKVLDHAEQNTRAAFAALRSASGVKSVQELTQIQTEFVKEAAQRSQTQIKEVGELITRFGQDAMSLFQPKI